LPKAQAPQPDQYVHDVAPAPIMLLADHVRNGSKKSFWLNNQNVRSSPDNYQWRACWVTKRGLTSSERARSITQIVLLLRPPGLTARSSN
jgi:hypothetical protein